MGIDDGGTYMFRTAVSFSDVEFDHAHDRLTHLAGTSCAPSPSPCLLVKLLLPVCCVFVPPAYVQHTASTRLGPAAAELALTNPTTAVAVPRLLLAAPRRAGRPGLSGVGQLRELAVSC